MDDRTPEELLAVAAAVLPGTDLRDASFAQGGSHTVVLLPGSAVVRIARTQAAAALLPRRTELLRRLGGLDLPFTVPTPLSEVVTAGGCTAVSLSWLDGSPSPKGEGGDAKELRALLEALRSVDTAPIAHLLARPLEYAGGDRWAEVMLHQAVPRLPAEWQAEGRRRVQTVLNLPPVPHSLVHGDLAGDNMRWDADGRLLGVLDWDLAQEYDPAVDAAALAWHGWDKVAAVVDADTFRRAHAHYLTAGLQQIAFAILNDRDEDYIEERTRAMTAWLARTTA
ncbi:phosphotransferase family protein [Streptacidiphilus carbonis]|jgi:aminoglycoside phosphotransferase (APT) family kinase protein|uniref:phosphotransferase family protein n=1 Tax=Streptacidiphilus carbonis TaxID=105422 RepID=UPI0005A74633|nr:aminoglycoside phosphotransferase family protein [Streptacidiphilus carbonis]